MRHDLKGTGDVTKAEARRVAREIIRMFVEGYNMADLEDRLMQHEFTMEKIERKQNRPVPRCNR